MYVEYENEYDYGYNNSNNRYKKRRPLTLKTKLILLGILGIVLIIGLIIASSIRNYYNSYEYFEKKMILSAKQYVKNNNMNFLKEVYFTADEIGIELKEGCNLSSGVFIEGDSYQAYLACDDYTTRFLNDNNLGTTLIGDEVTFLAKGIPYIEQGVNTNRQVITNGNVGTEEGVYNITYSIVSNNQIESVLNRKVIVIDNNYIRSLFPSIVLMGNSIVNIEKGDSYTDSGAIANDSVDGNITTKIRKIGEVNVNNPGEYDIVYTITNSRGYSNSVTRKVVVVNSFSTTTITALLSPSNLTNSDVTISLNVVGNNFSYLILPNNEKVTSTNPSYKVSENGIYSFLSYDKDGKSITKIIIVDNIDKSAPSGTCTATLYNDKTVVSVNATSNLPISGYRYNLGGVNSQYVTSNTYQAAIKKPSSVSVSIKNSLGTASTINCKIDDKTYREIYIGESGKQCLEGYTCFIQDNYNDTNKRFCSGPNNGNCGTIASNGCSVISLSTILSRFVKNPEDGEPYDPYEVMALMKCTTSCSGASTARRTANRLGLSTSERLDNLSKHKEQVIEWLKNDTPVLLRVGAGAYTSGGHLMAILGINEEGLVYLFDTGTARTTARKNKKFGINTWVSIDEVAEGVGKGNSSWVMAIGPAGMYPY